MYRKIKVVDQNLIDYEPFIEADYENHYSGTFKVGFINKSLELYKQLRDVYPNEKYVEFFKLLTPINRNIKSLDFLEISISLYLK